VNQSVHLVEFQVAFTESELQAEKDQVEATL
jgi:hypothetical protein